MQEIILIIVVIIILPIQEQNETIGLARRNVNCGFDGVNFGLRNVSTDGVMGDGGRLAGSNGNEDSRYYGVLPVVSLQSGVQLKPGSQEGEWSFVD